MGNINLLITNNPVEILPVEAYLSDLSCDSPENLGSTRFIKVAKGKTQEGCFVYKVFVRIDDMSLDPYPSRIIEIRKKLAKAPNCCPIKKVLVKPKYAVMLRVYQKHTLFDRLSTRPFVIYPEKIWYIFQLFKALSQCEAAGVCHGDLKSQNVLISSSNWLQITDFAPFKPSFLPLGNPSSFTFFFDTSRRESCYIAPERFVSSSEYERMGEHQSWLFESLKPSMDIFSAGCIVYELLCDGRVPFNYSQLYDYRAMTNNEASATLSKLVQDVPPQFRPLLKLLLNREPMLRTSASEVLRGEAFSFPPILENFLFPYLDRFRPLYGASNFPESSSGDLSQPLEFAYIEPDDIIAKLKKDKCIWWEKLIENDESKQFAVLFVSLITSNLRALRQIQIKVDAMEMLVDLSSLCESCVPIDRVVPYFVYFMSDPEPQIRATAIALSADVLAPVEPKTYEESLVFVDYLFPEINHLISDECPQHVLFQIATSLGSLVETAQKYLLIGRDIRSRSYDDDISMAENASATSMDLMHSNDDSTTLMNLVSAIFSSLCSKDPMVKRCLVEPQSLIKVYNFFAKCGNGDSLLTFLITFLNAKTEWRLRAAFFDSLPICVQKRSVGMVPLIQQGIQDSEEHVVVRAIGCIELLIRNEHLDRISIKELLPDVISFLVHPNEWIRQAVCDILIELDRKWHMADIHASVIPGVLPFIVENKRKTVTLKSRDVLMSSLIEPIPRQTLNQIIDLSLEKTKQMITLLEIHYKEGCPFAVGIQWLNVIFPKIDTTAIGDDARDISVSLAVRKRLLESIYSFRNMLKRMAETRNTAGMEHNLTRLVGIVDLSPDMYRNVKRNRFVYGSRETETDKTVINCPIDRKDTYLVDGEVAFEEERTTFGGTSLLAVKSSIFENQVNSVLAHLNDLYMKNNCPRKKTREVGQFTSMIGSMGIAGSIGGTSGKQGIKGTIVMHLHEHSKSVTKLSATHDNEMFASGSQDGTVKIWRTRSVLGEGYGAARSEDTWVPSKENREIVQSVGWCDQYVCAATEDGFVRWADVGNGGAKVMTSIRIPEQEGSPVYMHCNGPVCVLRTHHGVLYGLDLRVGSTSGPLGRHDVWRKMLLENHGLITCSTIDPWQQSWMVFGTNSELKNLVLYDLRFREEVHRWCSPHNLLRPLGVWANPVSRIDSPGLFVGYNMHGEVSSYELSVEPARRRVLWTGGSAVLSYNQEKRDISSSNVTKSLCVCETTGLVYTGDNRGAIRKWNMMKATGCEVVSAPPKIGSTPYRTFFDERRETETEPFVIYERQIADTDAKENRRIAPLASKPSTYHRTPITDMMLLSSELLVSSSFDGVIKIWK